MVKDVVSDILLGLAVVIVLGASAGVLVMRDACQKLHFVTPAALVAPVLVALAIFVQAGLYENTGETLVALLFMGRIPAIVATLATDGWDRIGFNGRRCGLAR